MTPVRIQRKRTKGWKMPENTVYVGRGSRWGNPFRIGETVCLETADAWAWRISKPGDICAGAEEAVRKFAVSLGLDDCMIAQVRLHLRGKNLACFCGLDQPCHADVLLSVANALPRLQ